MNSDKNMAFSREITWKNDYNYLCTDVAWLIKTALNHSFPKHDGKYMVSMISTTYL